MTVISKFILDIQNHPSILFKFNTYPTHNVFNMCMYMYYVCKNVPSHSHFEYNLTTLTPFELILFYIILYNIIRSYFFIIRFIREKKNASPILPKPCFSQCYNINFSCYYFTKIVWPKCFYEILVIIIFKYFHKIKYE